MGAVGTYDETLSTALDRIRLTLGDTTVTNLVLSDVHIRAVLTQHQENEQAATLVLAKEIYAIEVSRPIKQSVDGVSVEYSTAKLSRLASLIVSLEATLPSIQPVRPSTAIGVITTPLVRS